MSGDMSKCTRLSNVELLRIVSMFMVLVVHVDGASLGLPSLSGRLSFLNAEAAWKLVVESLAIVGVNCFTLISGYFGIRLSWRGMGGFLFQCLFYSVCIASVAHLCYPDYVKGVSWWSSWLVLSHTDLWYVPAYFGLMLLAPVLNRGVECMTKKEFSISFALFLLFNLWCGWWQGGKFNPTGYTLVQLILVYLAGRYIRLVVMDGNSMRKARGVVCRPLIGWLLAYFVFTSLIFLTSLWLPTAKAFAYNSPAVLGASVSLFMAFLEMRFTSRIVNYAAASAFAVYLIHKNAFVWVHFMKPFVVRQWKTADLWLFSLEMLLLCIGVYLAAMAVDAVRRRVWQKICLYCGKRVSGRARRAN